MPTRGCPAKGSSAAGVKIRSWAVSRSSTKDGFGEAQLGGEWSPALGWYRGTVDNHAEGTTESTLTVAEDAYDEQDRHGAGSPLGVGQQVSTSP